MFARGLGRRREEALQAGDQLASGNHPLLAGSFEKMHSKLRQPSLSRQHISGRVPTNYQGQPTSLSIGRHPQLFDSKSGYVMPNDSTTPSETLPPGDSPSFSVGPIPRAPIENSTSISQPAAEANSESATQNPQSQRDPDSQLVDQTKQQIRSLVHEIAELAQSDCSTEDFFAGFLTRTTNALASLGGAIWIREPGDNSLKLKYQINLKQTVLATDSVAQSRHSLLLNKLLEQRESSLVRPNSGTDDPAEAGNPTETLLVVGPLIVDGETIGLVEIFQRPNAGPTTQRGYLRFVTQMSDIASEFLGNQRLRSLKQQQAIWQQLEQFIRSVHLGLDTKQTIYTIANEGRRLTETDRLSVAVGTGRHCRVEAVSGLDSIERRADQVKKLGALAAKVIRTGQPLWYNGDDDQLPPQIEKRLHAYVDKSHGKMLAIIPLVESHTATGDEKKQTASKPIGALIIEQLKDSTISPTLRQRADILVAHSQTALTNSIDHNRIFLMPLWKALGRVLSAFRGGNLIKTSLVLGTLAAVVFLLATFPYPFGLGAKGSLIPETQHEVFAQVDGVLEQVFVSNTGDTYVSRDQPLARMTNNDLMVEIENLRGKIQESHEKLSTNRIIQSKGGLDPVDNQMIAGEIASAIQTINSLSNELNIKEHEAQLLNVLSPSDGQVINWQVRQNLLRRPVLSGQHLMTIIDPNTHWQIELEMPERRLAHLMKAANESDKPLSVTFGLVSHPGVEYSGHVLQIDRQLDVHSDEGNTALVRIGFNNEDVNSDLLRAGTRVTAKVHCGTRSIGYAIFHELIETVQSSVQFWL